MKKLLLSASILLSSLILQAQTQIDFGTFVTLRPDLTNQGTSYQRDIVTDPNGNVFGVGNTNITQVPKGTVQGNVVDSTFGGGQWDGYVYKLAADGKSLLWWTYLGGAGIDDIWGVDYSKEGANEYIYCTGFTDKTISVSASTVVKGTYKGQRDAFLAKYNALTGELVWLSWLGSAKDDCGFNVKVSSNYVHIVGYASRGISTTTGAYKTTLPDDWTYDGFYSKFDFSGNINYCTYTNFPSYYMDIYSGKGAMGARGLDVISDNDVIISGTTYGNDVSTEKNNTALKATGNLPSSEVGFILRLNTLAGGANDYIFGSKIRTKNTGYTFASDVKYNNGSFYVLGYSDGVLSNIPIGAFQETNAGVTDIFVLKIKASDYSIENASMYGGAGNEYASELTVCSGEPTFSGQTASNNLALVNYLTTGALSSPTRNQNTLKGGGNDLFTASLKNDFKSLSFSSYLGGVFDEHPFTSYTMYGKPGGLSISGNNLLIGASSHSFQDFPTTIGSLHHVTETSTNVISSPDLDFVVSFQKPGGSCAVTAMVTPDLDIDALNDSATGKDYKTTYIENASFISVVNTNSGGVTITDSDDTNIKSAIITLTNTQVNDVFTVIGTLPSGITSAITTSGINTIIILTGSATKANYQTALTLIKFSNTSDNPNTTDRNVTFQVTDNSSSTVSNTAITTIKVKAVNDNPVLDLDNNNNSAKMGADYLTLYIEKSISVNIADNDILITDADNTNLSSAIITLTNSQVGDNLQVGALSGGITSSLASNLGSITITLTGSTTLANYQSAIRNIVYSNTSSNPSTTDRFVTVQVNDGSANSNLATTTIKIFATNDNPVLDLDINNSSLKNGADFQTTYTEQTSAVNIGDVDTKITDVDNISLSSATITLTNKKLGDIIKAGTLTGGITAGYDSSQVGKVKITLTGVSSLTNYQDAIRNINFQNNRDNVDTTTRVIQVTVNDGQSNSNIVTTYIRVINVNDTVIVKNETVVTNEDETITNNLTTITANDVDPDGDVLTVTGIVATTKNGTTTIVGNTYVYDPNKFFFGKDTAVFNLCDPKGACKNDTLFISVNPGNDVLELDLDVNNNNDNFKSTGYQTTFTENDAHLGIDITDKDVSIFNPDLFDMTTATFILTNKKLGDSLYVKGTLASGLTSTLVSTGNTMTLTISGLKDSTAYKYLLTQIMFNNIREDVDTTTRILNVTVANTNGTSNIAQSLIKVININDTVITDNEYFTINEDSQLNNSLLSLLANDYEPEADQISVQTIINYGNNGNFSITNGNFFYNPNKDFNGRDTIVVSVCDTKNACSNDSLLITVSPVNDSPILDLDKNNNNDNTSYVNFQKRFSENTTQISVGDNDVYISDVDSNYIYSALIKLTNTKVGDSLIINGTLPNGIKDSLYTIGDTTYIKLKGEGKFVNYQNAIKLVNFKHENQIIDSTSRVIFVSVNDSLLNSNIAITTISIDNRSPLIIKDVYVTNQNVELTENLSDIIKNDKDPEGAKLKVSSIVENGSNGTFTIDGTNFTFTPKKDFYGKDTVIVSICDIKNACKNDTLFISVNEVIDNDTITFQDIAFKSALISLGIDKNADNKIQKKEVVALKKLNVSSKSISNLAGIEWFKALDSLNVSFNNLTNINLSALVNLTYLNASNNKLSDVSITNFANQRVSTIAPNTKLQTLLVNNNQLTKLDVSNLLALKVLDARVNSALFQVCVNPSHDLTNFKVDLTTTLTSTCGILTSIENELNNQPKTLVGIYNLIGQKIENEHAINGIYIFVYSDGSREKVLK